MRHKRQIGQLNAYEAVHCFLVVLAPKYLAILTFKNVVEPKIIIFVFEKIPPNFALPSADYQVCALKKHQNVPNNMLTKPQICCGCCAYPVQFVPWL